ncbi:MAG: NEW3 domain-containing protein [Methanoregula sp.]|jgi:uncharacterized membrane protein
MSVLTLPDRSGFLKILVSGFLICLFSGILAHPAGADLTTSKDTNILISCRFPGQIIEAGETAVFPLTITNTGPEINHKLWYESYDGNKYDWDIRFMTADNTTEINKLSIPQGEQQQVILIVETNSDTPVGDYSVRIHIGEGWYWAYVTISKTHKGELGTLALTVTDKDGEKVKGATVTLFSEDTGLLVDQVTSTADGSISAGFTPGTYRVLVAKTGYRTVEKTGVRIKGGITTDLKTIMLDKALYAADASVNSPIVAVSTGENPTYDLTLKNIGKSDDTFHLGFENVPSGWYMQYREKNSPAMDVSAVFVKSGGEKTLVIEAIPQYGAGIGEYNFSAVIDSSQATYLVNLTARIRGNYDLRVYADKYQYEVNKGDSLTFDLILTNAGTAGSLTNVNVTVSAPDGWTADVSPKTIAGIAPGERTTVTLIIIPPANIVASDYKITVSATSDQIKKTDDFRVVVHEQSLVAMFGIVLILGLCGGVYYLFRKYRRR